MFTINQQNNDIPKSLIYSQLAKSLTALIGEEREFLPNMSNMASLLFFSLNDINWSGFYLMKNKELLLGPFQGKPACVRIPMGKGVCGSSAVNKSTIIVEDVNNFPGHIACDVDSRSEIVIPLFKGEALIGVLDIDSPILARFDEEDKKGLEHLVHILMNCSEC
ncbi:MAG: GAF domain-containing protein [Ignavibacteria bacterium]|jgi:L-methionine (R)-S-oxide reductase